MNLSMDIDLAALVLIGAGLLGMGGLSVVEVGHKPDVLLNATCLAAAMTVLGVGLWQRYQWARISMVIGSLQVIWAQMSHRWLQTNVPHALLDAMRGMSMTSHHHHYSSTLVEMPRPDAGWAMFGLVICVSLGWLTWRLLSRRVAAEFGFAAADMGVRRLLKF